MKNAKELREELLKCFEQCKAGEITANKMKALASTAGVAINLTKVELDYNKYTDNNRKIDFLEV